VARADYYAIEEEIADILRAEALMDGVTIDVEGELTFEAGAAPWVGIYLERRDPSPEQYLDAGQSTRYRLRFTLWTWVVSLESIADAIKRRNDLMSRVEKVLMKNRTIRDFVDMSWLEGGDMPSGRLPADQSVYLSGAEIILIAEISTDTI